MADLYGITAAPVTDTEPRCSSCRRMLAYLVTRPWRIQCSRCKTVNASDDLGVEDPHES